MPESAVETVRPGDATGAERIEREGERYRTVLLPTDGSQGASRGIRRGLELADAHGATVHVLHVIDESTEGETPALSSEELALEALEEEAADLLDEVANEASELGLEAVTKCVRGDPCEEIRKYAADADVDLIVMGVHGTRAGARPHFGGTTERVVRTADVPVLTV